MFARPRFDANGTAGVLAVVLLAIGLAACQGRALPPPPSQVVVTLAPASPPDWSQPSDSATPGPTYPVETAVGSSAPFSPLPVAVGGRAPATKAPPPPIRAIFPSAAAPAGTGGYIAGTVWNDANRNRVFDPGEAALGKVRVEIDGCSSATIVIYTDASGGFSAAGLASGVCRLRFILAGFAFEGTVPSLGAPAPYPVLAVSEARRATYVNVAMVP